MLILTRAIGEKIKIGEEIEVTVLNRRGNHIVLGIDAPPAISIKRTELCAKTRPHEPSPESTVHVS